MKILNVILFRQALWFTFLLYGWIPPAAYAQNDPLCDDGDCPPAILSIRLDAPLQGPLSSERTEQFKTAYLLVKEIKNGLRQDPDWENSYIANELAGISCARLNQLESHLAYEYERNPDFQQFIGKQEPVFKPSPRTDLKAAGGP